MRTGAFMPPQVGDRRSISLIPFLAEEQAILVHLMGFALPQTFWKFNNSFYTVSDIDSMITFSTSEYKAKRFSRFA
jgi:hypothetical protein